MGRHPRAIGVNPHTLEQQNEISGPLQVPTGTSIQGRTRSQTAANKAQRNANPPTGTKRTFVSSESDMSINPTVAPVVDNSAKRLRQIGPVRVSPMPLALVVEGETAGSSEPVPSAQRMMVQQASYYPGCGQETHPFAAFSTIPNGDDSSVDSEGEWLDDLVEGPPSRISRAVAKERLSWKGSPSASGLAVSTPSPVGVTAPAQSPPVHMAMPPPSTSPFVDVAMPTPSSPLVNTATPTPTLLPRIDTPMSTPTPLPLVNMAVPTPTPSPLVNATMPTPAPAPTPVSLFPTNAVTTPPAWPAETDLVFAPGSTKLKLTLQQPLVRAVIGESIEILRAALLLENAFPNAALTALFLRNSLSSGARAHLPGATAMLRRLQSDTAYLAKILPVLRARICLFRGEVKEQCSALVTTAVLGMGSAAQIKKFVEAQLHNYRYIYPKNVNPGNGLSMSSYPYHNDRIITVIRSLYFDGDRSFVEHFRERLPLSHNNNGSMSYEVPMPMVALVATALYAALFEWRSGSQQVTEFSVNAFTDVYQGNLGTLEFIQVNRQGAFHVMMANIYSRASLSTISDTVGIQIANIDLDSLED